MYPTRNGRSMLRALVAATLIFEATSSSCADTQFTEQVAQLRLHNDSSAGYVFAVKSPNWCGSECEKNARHLSLMEVAAAVRMPASRQIAALLAVPIPDNGFSKDWAELDKQQRDAAALFGGDECSWPLASDNWPSWSELSPDHRAAAQELQMDDANWPPLFWANIAEVASILSGCGVDAVLMYRGVPQCHEPGHLIHIMGRCITSPRELRELLPSSNGSHSPTVILMESGPALAVVQASSGRVSTPAHPLGSAAANVTVDLLQRQPACRQYMRLPGLYWALVPIWSCLGLLWVGLSCQLHASFATTIHSVMALVPLLKLLDVAVSATLWTDCVASGTFSVAMVLAWVAVKSVYEPFISLTLLLIAHGWCTVRRDMPRATSLTVLAAVCSLYVALAVNFLYAGKYWWLAAAVKVVVMMFASSAARKLILDLTERLQTMGSDDFMELRSQTQCKKEMFGRVVWVVWIYCVLQMIDSTVLHQTWQGTEAWKSHMCDQAIEVLIVIATGYIFRPKQPGSGIAGHGHYFLDVSHSDGSRRHIPFYEMSPATSVASHQAEAPSSAVVVINPSGNGNLSSSQYAVGQRVDRQDDRTDTAS